VLIVIGGLAAVQGQVPDDGKEMSAADRLAEAINSGTVESAGTLPDGSDPARPDRPPEFVEDSETRAKHHEALQEYYVYRTKGLQHRQSVFKWQLLSAKVIFLIVLVVVGTGIVLAIIQFRAELKRLEQGASGAMASSTVEASTTGVKVSSSVVGIIILTLSLAFFYLYLIYVYPIADIF
jgi:hypothetical protein